MKVLLVDDEPLARERLRQLMGGLPGYEICGEAANGLDAIQRVDADHPDIVLLDIRMPGMDGMEAAFHMSSMDNSPAIVFTTAYGEHALEAFEAQAVDYLLKPVEPERLAQALEKASRLTQAQEDGLKEQTDSQRSHICARVRGNLKLIPIDDILYFQADQKYVNVRYVDGEVLIEDSLKSLEDEFGERFMRIHRNALVAIDRVAGMEKTTDGGHELTIRDSDAVLEVSRRHVAEVRKYLRNA
jgi:two-component system response regulator AlgR